jgi:hypothetical protein
MSTPSNNLSPIEQLMAQNPAPAPAPSGSSDLSPIEQLMQSQAAPSNPGADIQPINKSTNPKLLIASSGEGMPEYVGAVGAGAAGLAALAPGADAILGPATDLLSHVGNIIKVARATGLTAFGLKEALDVYDRVKKLASKESK